MKRIIVLITLLCVGSSLCGCSATEGDAVDLPDSKAVQRMELQFIDGCALSKVIRVNDEDKDAILEKIRTAGEKGEDSVYDTPQEDPYITVSIYTKEHKDDQDVYFYRKNGDYYMEQPYIGVWEVSEELYNMLNEYVGEPAEPSKTIEGDTEAD